MADQNSTGPYGSFSAAFEDGGFVPIPVVPGRKTPAVKDWTRTAALTIEERRQKRRRFSRHGIGLLAGTMLSTGLRFGFVDVDDERLFRFVKQVLTPFASGKRGRKGGTIFCQVEPSVRSVKLRLPDGKAPAIEIFASTGMTVMPPSIHPSGAPYKWLGSPLLEIKHDELPILTRARIEILSVVVRNTPAMEIVSGGSGLKAHDLMLSLTSSGIANLSNDLAWLADCLNELFPHAYEGDTKSQTLGMLESAKEKGLGLGGKLFRSYDPGTEGPVPLGFTRDGNFAFRDPIRNLIITASAGQLLSQQFLPGLAPSAFWANRFPTEKGWFNAYVAGEALMASCRHLGPFNPLNVRGRGIWREGPRVIINLGDPIPADVKRLYVCFEQISLKEVDRFDTNRLLAFLKRFRWRNSQDAMLLLGWLAIAPICGVLNWRPHCFVYGPPRSGKTTIHTIAAAVLYPLVISTDGQSSEAGIRQTIGPDSLPIIMDEFESDQQGGQIRAVLRLARSASSADNPVLRGTPEGKALQFSLRTAFFFCAVNPGRMSPADQSRILMLELLQHSNDREVAAQIIEDEAYFRELGPNWCGYMVSLANLLGSAIDIFELEISFADRRHRQNFSTLLAGAFVSLQARVPTRDEARAWAQEYAPSVERHAEEIERDNSIECLEHLLAHVVDRFPLGHWIAVALLAHLNLASNANQCLNAERITRTFDIVVRTTGEHQGVLIKNGSPNIEAIFEGTTWEGRGWERALRGLEGAFAVKNPVYFSGTGTKSRCIGIPASYIPQPIETGDEDD